MPLKRPENEDKTPKDRTSGDAASDKADKVFSELDKKFKSMNTTSEVVSFRVPKGEKLRLKNIFKRNGMTLAEGLKAAVYKYTKELE